MKFDKMFLLLSFVILFTTVSWISSCTHKADLTGMYNPCPQEVQMIFKSNCVKFISGTTTIHCHDLDGSAESGYKLDTITDIRNAVTPGDPYSSAPYKAIIAKRGESQMPPSGPLSLDNRIIIRLWIEQGAKTEFCTDFTGVDRNDPYPDQRSGANRESSAKLSLPAKSDNLKSRSIPAL
jgi:hypothetical protein